MFAQDFPRRPMGRLVAIKRDGARQSAQALKRPPEKRFGCRDVPLGAEQKIDGPRATPMPLANDPAGLRSC